MELIPGITKEDYSDYVLYFIENLSEELKSEIRNRLVAVCHGADQSKSSSKIYSYKETAKEFIRRYKTDKNASEERKKGMIGELLIHVILELEGRFTTASPFFNMEERSFKKGYSFKNLVGRVCRFSEIFNSDSGTLKRLEPEIYLVFGRYFAQKANCENFLRNVAKVEQKYKDDVENVLLSQAEIDSGNEDKLRQASEFIENYENGIIEDYQDRYTKTDVGKACIMNGVSEIDVFSHEIDMQQQVDTYTNDDLKISDSSHLLEIINALFIQYLPDNGQESLKRLENKEARNFYAMMFGWRVGNKSYSEMISLFVGYWHQLYKKDKNVMVYVGKWGDVKRPGSNVPRYTRFIGKNRTQVINLAIVRIKEEQDFIDNTLIKYVEVLHDLGLIEDKFYAQIKYGTDDENTICLIKNGLSLSSAVLLIKKYRVYLQIDVPASTVTFENNLISEMEKEKENQILIYEVQSCM